MLTWTLIFLGVALVAGLLGFTGISVAAAGIARVLFTIFIILFLASLIFHVFAEQPAGTQPSSVHPASETASTIVWNAGERRTS